MDASRHIVGQQNANTSEYAKKRRALYHISTNNVKRIGILRLEASNLPAEVYIIWRAMEPIFRVSHLDSPTTIALCEPFHESALGEHAAACPTYPMGNLFFFLAT